MLCRENEVNILQNLLESDRPEFLAIYGRRRVGKTYLINQFFSNQDVIYFRVTGEKNGAIEQQIERFVDAIGKAFYPGITLKACQDWDAAFHLLTECIEKSESNKKIVLFMDEFPWMATPKSGLLGQLDYYWNHTWSNNSRVKLIICGSSASWIIRKILRNKGGLHNRITSQIRLAPFKLSDTQRFLQQNGIKLNQKQIIEIYMLTGGIPYYLSHIKKGLSATQIIEQLAFGQASPLLSEFDVLFSSLFNHAERHIALIKNIAKRRYGIEQSTLLETMGTDFQGQKGLVCLQELVDAGFIMRHIPYGRKRNGIYYRVIDEYTLFYLKWIEPIKATLVHEGAPEGYWAQLHNTPSWQSWSGLTFETICYKHAHFIARALNLTPAALPYTWRYIPSKGSNESGAQIDLLFDRQDQAITLCEIKFNQTPYTFSKQDAINMEQKKAIFLEKTKIKKQVFFALICANGVKNNAYIDVYIDQVITLDALFRST